MHLLLYAFIILLVFKTGFETWLEILNRRHVRAASGSVPEPFREFIDPKTYAKTIDYTLAKSRFGFLVTYFDAALLAIILMSGLLPWLYGELIGLIGNSLWGQSLALLAISIIFSLPSIPFEWWQQFRLEEQFGFNKSTLKLWISDNIKGMIIALLFGFPVLCVLLWLVELPVWWLWAFAVVFAFQLLMIVVYPMFIMPLFNKFEPLAEGGLRERLMALADKTGFKAKAILVMDGSKRSGHSNAFFTGFGNFRRIVLFDTLMEQLEEDELEAVLAHEIGHYKLGHITRTLAVSAVTTLISFRILAALAESPWFYQGFGFTPAQGLAPALLLFGLLGGLVTFWLQPAMSFWSRKHEYEADAFARDAVKSGKPMVSSLRKLHEKNLSNLTPHPTYSAFYYSHPTLLEREAAIASIGSD